MEMNDITNELMTPGWQYFKRAIAVVVAFVVMGVMFQVLIANNPDEWKTPTGENGYPLVNGAYFSSQIFSFTALGDYVPLSKRAIVVTMLFVLLWWGVMLVLFPTF